MQLERLRQTLEPLRAVRVALLVQARVDPAHVHAVALLLHLGEEVELLVHLCQVLRAAQLHARQRGVLHGLHVAVVQFDGLLEQLQRALVLAGQELQEAEFDDTSGEVNSFMASSSRSMQPRSTFFSRPHVRDSVRTMPTM